MKKFLPLLILSGSVAFGDIIMNPPFVRSKGMAEALTAAGGDISAIYYNPATLVNFSLDKTIYFFSLGIGSSGYIDARKGEVENTTMGFLGLGGIGKNFGLALGAYSLSEASFRCDANALGSYCQQKTTVANISLAFKLFKIEKTGTGLALGLSGFLPSATYDEFLGNEKINTEIDLSGKPGGVVGAYLRLFESEHLSLDLGASYRSKANIYEEAYTENKETFFDIPPALFYGVAVKVFLPFAYLIVSYDEQDTFYSEMDYKLLGDSKRRSVGVEVASEKVVLRGGIFREEYENSLIDSSGFTGGISLKIGGHFILSGAGEFRRTELGNETFNSVSAYLSLDVQW